MGDQGAPPEAAHASQHRRRARSGQASEQHRLGFRAAQYREYRAGMLFSPDEHAVCKARLTAPLNELQALFATRGHMQRVRRLTVSGLGLEHRAAGPIAAAAVMPVQVHFLSAAPVDV